MSATDITQLKSLAEKLTAFHGTVQAQPGDRDIYTHSHFRAYERLQTALREFEKDPTNPDRSKSMLHAMENHQTATEMMILKVESVVDQFDEADEEVGYPDVFKQYM